MSDSRHNEHILPIKTYVAVAAGLFILTAVTVGVSFIHLGGWNAVVAFGVATIKGLLVAMFFMHLLYDRKIYLIIFATALLFLGVFIALTMFDILLRGPINPDTSSPIKNEAVIYEKNTTDSLQMEVIEDNAAVSTQSGH
ncbi:MAG: cytochrome C oxidase subunit IV family protein [Candidatus Zixiibacteriota bacterium]